MKQEDLLLIVENEDKTGSDFMILIQAILIIDYVHRIASSLLMFLRLSSDILQLHPQFLHQKKTSQVPCQRLKGQGRRN